jgi:hypothetical protein
LYSCVVSQQERQFHMWEAILPNLAAEYMGCPLIGVSYFYGIRENRRVSIHLRTEKGPVSENLCFLV